MGCGPHSQLEEWINSIRWFYPPGFQNYIKL
ncbi:MAG: hypothetical protein MRERV_3c124 [Mycoplasmataceae bacterium RV_VA103A]|nr:MAG: hypothetical protein MRERV_3c124 [Mycoplasmataceae bacterium RV_VA103A]